MCRIKLLPRSVFHTREHPQSSGSARGARPASNWIIRFFRRNVPNKASAALRIPHKGTSTEQRECPRYKTRLELDSAVFQAQCAEQSFCRAPYSAQGNIHRAAGVPEVQDPPRIGLCGFSGAKRRAKLLPRSVFRTREHPQSSGGARGGKTRLELDSAVFSGIRRRKPPRSCWLRGGPAVTGMGDATRT